MRKAIALMLLVAMLVMVGCATHVHVVGDGGKGSSTEKARQWYILFGLVPLNDISSKQMAKGSSNYTITTEVTPLDFLINIFTGIVTINSRTVEIKK